MKNFRNDITPIVRIKNREYLYIKNTIYGYSSELSGLGFEHHDEAPTYREYSRPVEKSEIESAYRVKWNYGIYKGVQVLVADYQKDTGKIFIMVGDDKQGNELRELEIVHVIAHMDNAELYDKLIEEDDVLINGEEEYGADCSAGFIAKFSSYLMWFKHV